MSVSTPVIVGEKPPTALPPESPLPYEHLVTEDDTPVDNLFSEKQMRLLTRPLYSSWAGPNNDYLFAALANVAMFFAFRMPPLVPDVLLAVGVKLLTVDLRKKRNRSFYSWRYGKSPEAAIEIVSNKQGGELGTKKNDYVRAHVPLYVVWDPYKIISSTPLQCFRLGVRGYSPVSPKWFDQVGLGLRVWHGTFEQVEADWLRWCDRDGNVIPLGEERAEQEQQNAEQERQRAEQERQRAEQERQRAEQAEQRIARLEAKLRGQGIDPGNGQD